MSRTIILGTLLMFLSLNNNAIAQEKNEDNGFTIMVHDLPGVLDFAGEKVPLEYPSIYEAVERELLTTCNMHTGTMRALRNTTRYFPIIEPILEEHGIPNDFKYLCIAESGLNPEAISPAKAAGLWQFITSAAKTYQVETGSNVDLRYNIEISTHAACRYLNAAYEIYGSWTLAAASYNAGKSGVSRRLKTQGVDDYWDLYLPEETMRYVPRILSFKILLENPSKYGFEIEEEDYFPTFKNYKEVKVNHQNIEWSKFAKEHGTTYRQLRILNPWIRSYSYTNKTKKTYIVKVPTKDFKKMGY